MNPPAPRATQVMQDIEKAFPGTTVIGSELNKEREVTEESQQVQVARSDDFGKVGYTFTYGPHKFWATAETSGQLLREIEEFLGDELGSAKVIELRQAFAAVPSVFPPPAPSPIQPVPPIVPQPVVPQPTPQPAPTAEPPTAPAPVVTAPPPPPAPVQFEACDNCQGPKTKWVPPGVSRSSGKAYDGFWACPINHRSR